MQTPCHQITLLPATAEMNRLMTKQSFLTRTLTAKHAENVQQMNFGSFSNKASLQQGRKGLKSAATIVQTKGLHPLEFQSAFQVVVFQYLTLKKLYTLVLSHILTL